MSPAPSADNHDRNHHEREDHERENHDRENHDREHDFWDGEHFNDSDNWEDGDDWEDGDSPHADAKPVRSKSMNQDSWEDQHLLDNGFQILDEFDINQSFEDGEPDPAASSSDLTSRSDFPVTQAFTHFAHPAGDTAADTQRDAAELLLFESLWADAEKIWQRNFGRDGYEHYVAADFRQVYAALQRLRGSCLTFLEWGSGLGVATIMAQRMGFQAYGIEIAPQLLDVSRTLAQAYDVAPRFVAGSFIPPDYQWDPEIGDSDFHTPLEGHSAYDHLDVALNDFDIIYAYPWPNETELFIHMMQECGSSRGHFITYHATEGIHVTHRHPSHRRTGTDERP